MTLVSLLEGLFVRPSNLAYLLTCLGSLPSNVDQGDLSRMLMDHLSEHTQIKNVKVVRDSKGGVCAFVQCLVNLISSLAVRKLTYMRSRMRILPLFSLRRYSLTLRNRSLGEFCGMNLLGPSEHCWFLIGLS